MSRIRLGMVGGGRDAFIGGVHRIAARIDGEFDLVAGALSSTPEKARESGEALGLAPNRTYGDFRAIFSKFAAMDFDGWAVVEWECCLKHPEDGAREGAAFVKDHIIRVTEKAFDDFADGGTDDATNRKMLGID